MSKRTQPRHSVRQSPPPCRSPQLPHLSPSHIIDSRSDDLADDMFDASTSVVPSRFSKIRSSRRSLSLGKQLSKKRRRQLNAYATAEIVDLQGNKFEAERRLPPLKALNPTQAEYIDALRGSPQ